MLRASLSCRFQRNNNEHIVEVRIKEQIRFLCPFYDTPQDEMEHYIIYRVSIPQELVQILEQDHRECNTCTVYVSLWLGNSCLLKRYEGKTMVIRNKAHIVPPAGINILVQDFMYGIGSQSYMVITFLAKVSHQPVIGVEL